MSNLEFNHAVNKWSHFADILKLVRVIGHVNSKRHFRNSEGNNR